MNAPEKVQLNAAGMSTEVEPEINISGSTK